MSRVLHWHRGSHGFDSLWSLIICKNAFKSCVHSKKGKSANIPFSFNSKYAFAMYVVQCLLNFISFVHIIYIAGTTDNNQSYLSVFIFLPGNYSQLTVSFTFRRSVGYYVMQVYTPDVLVVAISWTLFWMDKHVRLRIAWHSTTKYQGNRTLWCNRTTVQDLTKDKMKTKNHAVLVKYSWIWFLYN